jgi:cellulose biosynthesis protein BcsQ
LNDSDWSNLYRMVKFRCVLKQIEMKQAEMMKMNKLGKIVTFYEFKEGAGCTTALMNIANLLAQEDYKVLIVDMDLSKYGMRNFVDEKHCGYGFMNLIFHYKDLLRDEYDEKSFMSILEDFIACNSYTQLLSDNISYISAGVNIDKLMKIDSKDDFDWNNFYKVWHGYGFLEAMIEKWRENYDYILVDSQSGLSDVAGICTLQFPDTVLFFYELNEQSLQGTKRIADSLIEKSYGFNQAGIPRMEFIGSKIFTDSLQLPKWNLKTFEILHPYISAKNHIHYIQRYRIPYIGVYSFGERILTVNDPDIELIDKYKRIMNDFIIKDKR